MFRPPPPKPPRDARPCGPPDRSSTPRSNGFARNRSCGVRDSRPRPIARSTRWRILSAPSPNWAVPRCSRPRRLATTARASFESTRPSARPKAWNAIGRQEAVLEAFIDFEREISVVAARGEDGAVRTLRRRSRTSTAATFWICRSRLRECRTNSRARLWKCPAALLDRLDVVGVLCVEFFVTRGPETTDQRTRAAAAQLRTPDRGRLRHQPVRTTIASGLRPAVGIDCDASASGHGQSAGRSVGERRAELAGRVRVP